MKTLTLLGLWLALAAPAAMADQITFSFVLGTPNSVTASASGLTMNSARNVLVSDTTTGTDFPLTGTYTASTGASSSFSIGAHLVIAGYTAGGPQSVLIENGSHILVAGTMDDNGAFLSSFPNGTGSFLGKFSVTTVDPAVLALFGLGPKFSGDGSVSATFGSDQLTASTIHGVIGGGTVTIETPSIIPEPAGLGLAGLALVVGAAVTRKTVHLR